jgi:hypothetical protein
MEKRKLRRGKIYNVMAYKQSITKKQKSWRNSYIFQKTGVIYGLLVLFITVFEVINLNNHEICDWSEDSGQTVQFGAEVLSHTVHLSHPIVVHKITINTRHSAGTLEFLQFIRWNSRNTSTSTLEDNSPHSQTHVQKCFQECLSTVMVSPDPLSPAPQTSSAIKTPENREEEPDGPEQAKEMEYSSDLLCSPSTAAVP